MKIIGFFAFLIVVSEASGVQMSCQELLSVHDSRADYAALMKELIEPSPEFLLDRRQSHPRNKKALARRWVNDLLASDPEATHFRFNEPLAPDAPEFSVYNWGINNYENLTQGISRENLKELSRKNHDLRLGLYTSMHPMDGMSYGSLLMEVVVYEGEYPVQRDDGSIEMRPIQSYQIYPDGPGGFDLNLTTFLYGTDLRLLIIYDLAIIKEIRWPDKDMIQRVWETAVFTPSDDANIETHRSSLRHSATQWLMTPNYTEEERASLFRSQVDKFSLVMDNSFEMYIHANVKNPSVDFNYLLQNGIFKTLLDTEEDLISHSTGRIDFEKAHEAFKALSEEARGYLNQVMTLTQNSNRIKLVLELFLNVESGVQDSEALLAPLLRFYELNKEEYSVYNSYNPSLIDEEVSTLRSFVSALVLP